MWIEKSRDQLFTSGKTDIWAFEKKTMFKGHFSIETTLKSM